LQYRILADESVDYRIVTALRRIGFEIISIIEKHPSVSDKRVLELAREYEAILVTEDKDFGEWIFSYHEQSFGVILLRYKSDNLLGILNSLNYILNKYGDALLNKFSVVKINKIRIREI
jgi:predicted nuclease of predicted toxin-antitoxin system